MPRHARRQGPGRCPALNLQPSGIPGTARWRAGTQTEGSPMSEDNVPAHCNTTAPPGAAARAVTLHVNGNSCTLQLEPRCTLLDALREVLQLTGAKKGCDRGQCGACTVLVDGRRINACLTLAVMQEGREITTIEGLASGDTLHPMQQAFVTHDALQCGFCTPGQICSAVGMLAEAQAGHASAVRPLDAAALPLTDDEIRERMSGNLCRCGAYPNIVAAVREACGAGGGS
ncbi:2Fe-2S iron-sulfur cluster-binding protein [Cupriavidus nantongensis]